MSVPRREWRSRPRMRGYAVVVAMSLAALSSAYAANNSGLAEPPATTRIQLDGGADHKESPVLQSVQKAWTSISGERPSGGPWLFDDKLVYHTYNGRVVALSAASGSTEWEARSESPYISEPIVDRELMYFSAARFVTALRLDDGTTVWRFRKGNQADSGLVLDARAVYLNSGREVHALDRATGKELWRVRLESANTYRPVPAGTVVLLGDAGGRLIAVDAQSGEVRWKSSGPASLEVEDRLLSETGRAARTREAKEVFRGMGSRSLLPWAIGVCDARSQGRAEADIVANLAEFFGRDVAAAIAIGAQRTLCPPGTTREEIADLARSAEAGGGNEVLVSPPSVHGKTVAFRTRVGPESGAIQVADLDSGRVVVRWSTRVGAGSPPVLDGTAVFSMDQRELVAKAIEGGRRMWSLNLESEGGSYDTPLALMDGKVFAITSNAILEIDRTTGTIVRRIPASGFRVSAESLLRGEICATGSGLVYRVDVLSPESEWAVSRADLVSPSSRIACRGDALFYYEDRADYPLHRLEVRRGEAPRK